MPRYRVKVDSLTGKNGRTFYRGDSVTDENFISAEELVRQGFLEEFIEMSVEPVVLNINDYTRVRLMDLLNSAGVGFSKNASKIELFEKLKAL